MEWNLTKCVELIVCVFSVFVSCSHFIYWKSCVRESINKIPPLQLHSSPTRVIAMKIQMQNSQRIHFQRALRSTAQYYCYCYYFSIYYILFEWSFTFTIVRNIDWYRLPIHFHDFFHRSASFYRCCCFRSIRSIDSSIFGLFQSFFNEFSPIFGDSLISIRVIES